MKWKFWHLSKTYPKSTLPPMHIARELPPGKYFQTQRKDLLEETKILSDEPFRLSTGSRLPGHENQSHEDIIEALRRSQVAIDEIQARYPGHGNQFRRRTGHVPLLVPMLSIEQGPGLGHGLLGESPQGHHPPMQKLACEMIRVTEDKDIPCASEAIGITTDGVHVCFSCGRQMRSENFLVLPLKARARELLFPFAHVGDRFRFTYPEEPQFDVILTVVKVKGFQPSDLVFFDDETHCKQLVIGILERIPTERVP